MSRELTHKGYKIFELPLGKSVSDGFFYRIVEPPDSFKRRDFDTLKELQRALDTYIPTRSDMPPEVYRLAKWIKFGGSPPEYPHVYGWQVDTRDTDLVRNHPEIDWLKSRGFTHKGRKWNLVDWDAPGFRSSEAP